MHHKKLQNYFKPKVPEELDLYLYYLSMEYLH